MIFEPAFQAGFFYLKNYIISVISEQKKTARGLSLINII